MLKKPSLDADCLKNYRQVSNLSFISKQTERVVTARLNEHMSQFELFEPLQSAIRPRTTAINYTHHHLHGRIRAHGLDYHLFADDSQLYVFVKPVQANVDGGHW